MVRCVCVWEIARSAIGMVGVAWRGGVVGDELREFPWIESLMLFWEEVRVRQAWQAWQSGLVSDVA